MVLIKSGDNFWRPPSIRFANNSAHRSFFDQQDVVTTNAPAGSPASASENSIFNFIELT